MVFADFFELSGSLVKTSAFLHIPAVETV